MSAAATHYRMMRNSGAAPRYRYAIAETLLHRRADRQRDGGLRRADLRPAGLQHVRHHRDRRDPGELSRRRGFRRQAGLAGQADPRRQARGPDAEGKPCPPGVVGETEGVAARRLDRDQGSRPHRRGRLLLPRRPRRRRHHLRRLDDERRRDRERDAEASATCAKSPPSACPMRCAARW